jgi:serine/threonine protein phosphatase PrpC
MNDVHTFAGGTLLAAVRSDPGRIRTNNEDLPLVDAGRGIYGVIDGVGGQAAGEIAARIARDVILQRLARPLGTPAERVREAIAIANNEIYSRAEDEPELRGMACVVTLAIAADGTLTIGHVGDTRLYKIRPDGLRKLTHDHSPVGEREDARELTEAEAMRHPRRNEVFRDIGSAYRDKDEEDFVEVIVEPLETDSAVLLCSDGLTDMIPSSTIARLVQQHAGHPQDVADALVAAANAAGGKDNVTVVYAEAPDFAPAMRQVQANLSLVALPSSSSDKNNGSAAGSLPGDPVRDTRSASPGTGTTAAVSRPRRVLRSRTTWFSAGALAGVGAALFLAWQGGTIVIDSRRTLVVEPDGSTGLSRISDAMAAALPNDTVRVEPGVYHERVIVPNDVDLIARIPGTVTIARPSNASGEVVGISVFGNASSSVSGIRLESTPDLPLDVGVRVYGQGVTLEQMELSGAMRAGIEVGPGGAVAVRGSQFVVQGASLALGDESSATVTHNTILRTGRPLDAPFSLSASSQVVFRANVFAGFGSDVVKGMTPALRQHLLAGNYVVAGEPALVR